MITSKPTLWHLRRPYLSTYQPLSFLFNRIPIRAGLAAQRRTTQPATLEPPAETEERATSSEIYPMPRLNTKLAIEYIIKPTPGNLTPTPCEALRKKLKRLQKELGFPSANSDSDSEGATMTGAAVCHPSRYARMLLVRHRVLYPPLNLEDGAQRPSLSMVTRGSRDTAVRYAPWASYSTQLGSQDWNLDATSVGLSEYPVKNEPHEVYLDRIRDLQPSTSS